MLSIEGQILYILAELITLNRTIKEVQQKMAVAQADIDALTAKVMAQDAQLKAIETAVAASRGSKPSRWIAPRYQRPDRCNRRRRHGCKRAPGRDPGKRYRGGSYQLDSWPKGENRTPGRCQETPAIIYQMIHYYYLQSGQRIAL